jgi:fibronectin type 3 domain-containing protein
MLLLERQRHGNYSGVVSKFTTPAAPLVTASPVSSTSIKISWAAVKGASGYEIYTATSSTGTYTLLKSTTLTSLTVLDCTSGTAYYYKVRAYTIVGISKVYGAYSSVVNVTP